MKYQKEETKKEETKKYEKSCNTVITFGSLKCPNVKM